MKKVLLFFVLGLFLIGCGEESFPPSEAEERSEFMQLGTALRSGDEACLEHLVLTSEDKDIRMSALGGVTDEGTIESVALNDPEWRIRFEATRRLSNPDALAYIVLSEEHEGIISVALRKLEGERDLLWKIVRESEDPDIRTRARLYLGE